MEKNEELTYFEDIVQQNHNMAGSTFIRHGAHLVGLGAAIVPAVATVPVP